MEVVEVVPRTHHSTAGLLVKNELLMSGAEQCQTLGFLSCLMMRLSAQAVGSGEKPPHFLLSKWGTHIVHGDYCRQRNAGST